MTDGMPVKATYEEVLTKVIENFRGRFEAAAGRDESPVPVIVNQAIMHVVNELDVKGLAGVFVDRPEIAELDVSVGGPGVPAARVMRAALATALRRDIELAMARMEKTGEDPSSAPGPR